jgi:hypothetical protein
MVTVAGLNEKSAMVTVDLWPPPPPPDEQAPATMETMATTTSSDNPDSIDTALGATGQRMRRLLIQQVF